MAEAPKKVALSEAFHGAMSRQRLVAAVFLTFRFDPGFFEEEVLPVFFDRPFSTDRNVKLAQVGAELRERPGSVAVYYDVNGLKKAERSSRLDIGRFAVRMEHGIFHPKNVFALVEADEPGSGPRPRKLLAACLSANLTVAGWWKNLEVAHLEELEEGDGTLLADDLRPFLRWLHGQPVTEAPQRALEEILAFLVGRGNRPEAGAQEERKGKFPPRFYWGGEGADTKSVPAFIMEAAGTELQGLRMEVVSPYFDREGTARCQPLEELLAAFKPTETRVFLPRGPNGRGLLDPGIHQAVAGLANVFWSGFPRELLKMGPTADAALRTVHAKVVRFFSQTSKREVLFVGSANLTRAAFSGNANRETGFLVKVGEGERAAGTPDFWLEVDGQSPGEFQVEADPEEPATTGGTRLVVVHDWSEGVTRACWAGSEPSPPLVVSSNGSDVFRLAGQPARSWQTLPAEASAALAERLKSSSFFDVREGTQDEKPGLLLVQEIGMFQKPSLAAPRSAADILKDWAAPSDDRRAEMIDGAESGANATAGPEERRAEEDAAPIESLFDRFAGIFHGFASLEKRVVAQLRSRNDDGTAYLLFGTTFNSLDTFLRREKAEDADPVNVYVSFLCAKQVLAAVRKQAVADPEGRFVDRHGRRLRELEEAVESPLVVLREQLTSRIGGDGVKFLDWFDRWFLNREAPAGEAA